MNTPIDTITSAETPEGIAISIRPAGFAVRCTAFATDAIIRFFILTSVVTALNSGGRFGVGPIFISLFIINWLYPIVFELLPGAATPGKRVFGLQVMMANGLPITPAGSLIRNLMRAVDLLPSMYAFGLITILLRRDARRLGDLAAGTVVVYRSEVAVPGAFGAAEPTPPPVALTARQQAAVAAFAWRSSRLTPQRAEEIAVLAAPVLPGDSAGGTLSTRLTGIARWLHGQRRMHPEARADMTALEFETLYSPRWSELEALLTRGERELDPERFLLLYRMCCEHLALAQGRGYPGHVIERLSIVAGRAHQIAYRQSDFGAARVLRTLSEIFPRSVRAHWPYMASAALLLMVPALAIGVATYLKPELILSIVDSNTAAEFDRMYSPAAASIGRLRDAGSNWSMFGFYIMNNIGIAFQCFVTGVIFGLGSLYFLVQNGIFGGAIAGYVASQGNGPTFFTFIATHSAFELTAIVLCGGAGLRIGRSVLLPGRFSRLASLQTAARETSPIVFGAAIMLVIAACLEAFWSSAAWVAPQAKLSCAAACWGLVILFFLRRPRAG